MVMNEEPAVPPTKIPPISMNVGPLLRALLERVWVTKYFGAPAEIFEFSSEMPLCEALPDSHRKQDDKSGTFLWQQGCLPLEILWEVDSKDLSGTAIVRMLDFDKASEVLEDTFEIIRADSLGSYKITENNKEIIKNAVKEILDAKNIQPSFGYARFFRTYPELEGRFYLEESLGENSNVTSRFKEIQEKASKYFSLRGKKNALKIEYNPKDFVKKGNFVEYYLILPIGFFGMEDADQLKRGKTP